MALTIILNDIRIDDWTVNVVDRCVEIHYKRLKDDGSIYDDSYAVFWETIPPVPDPPDNWYQLPATHVQAIIDLTQDARTALGNLVGGLP
jgi:hypothetical protein